MNRKYCVAILKSESEIDHLPWVEACKKLSDRMDYTVIDLLDNKWQEACLKKNYDIFLLRPPGRTELLKTLYDQRIILLSEFLGKRIYPSVTEVLIYENKRFLNDWLNAFNLPHPQTFVYYRKKEASEFIRNRRIFPIVAKSNIGASGNGVIILLHEEDAGKYIRDVFSKGVVNKTGPKLGKGNIFVKLKKIFTNKGFVIQRISDYYETFNNPQKGFVIFQEYIPHNYEWRVVRIGESYFAHKKIGDKEQSQRYFGESL